jgi:RES domain-containing protein
LIVVYRIGYCPTPVPSMPALLASLGYGSTLGNGRWHTQGPAQVVYCGSSRALCQLEKRVHANGANLKDQALMQLTLPAGATVQHVRALGLPADWRVNDAVTQQMGDAWIASGASLGMWVPSFVEPAEENLLLNPAHPSYPAITLTIERHPFVFDPRMF